MDSRRSCDRQLGRASDIEIRQVDPASGTALTPEPPIKKRSWSAWLKDQFDWVQNLQVGYINPINKPIDGRPHRKLRMIANEEFGRARRRQRRRHILRLRNLWQIRSNRLGFLSLPVDWVR